MGNGLILILMTLIIASFGSVMFILAVGFQTIEQERATKAKSKKDDVVVEIDRHIEQEKVAVGDLMDRSVISRLYPTGDSANDAEHVLLRIEDHLQREMRMANRFLSHPNFSLLESEEIQEEMASVN